jgi:transposase
MQKRYVELTGSDKEYLTGLLHQSGLRSKVLKRVMALLELDKGKTIEEARGVLGVSYPTMAKVIKRYRAEGLGCLVDKKQPGRPPRIDGTQRAKITALACSAAPKGHAQWSLRLLADKIVELNYCESISHEHVNRILKKMR